jgi:hypothetical protein
VGPLFIQLTWLILTAKKQNSAQEQILRIKTLRFSKAMLAVSLWQMTVWMLFGETLSFTILMPKLHQLSYTEFLNQGGKLSYATLGVGQFLPSLFVPACHTPGKRELRMKRP